MVHFDSFHALDAHSLRNTKVRHSPKQRRLGGEGVLLLTDIVMQNMLPSVVYI